ncbi:hypothetical protein [Acidipila rosea]|uniref:Uncharacterized protein n=1 Tax=Acidipila rosea TaxID=768535 RepID=A0A4R1L672_9BACT|nr:hypothetical protein [Acidipila rosea]MBW4026355.1 hypothetical protein [Acidobacteriota bacterium]MBW4044509.1 hypothetical protein [Acidobacteriota bacterium]TCK72687.1 hypothetical protein C7378_2275 [Acidipila rosea]
MQKIQFDDLTQSQLPMADVTLFVSSSDDYEDCWLPFFTLLKKFWPDCTLPIILNTENKSFSLEGLNILCTQTGKQSSFGKTFHAGLEHVKTPNILLIMIDYFIMKEVNLRYLRDAYSAFIEENLDAIYLVDMKTIKETKALRDNLFLIAGPGQDRFSFQAALWKKSSIRKYVLKHENPWLSEYFGSLRFKYSNDRIAFVDESAEPFKYLHTGALHKGGWIKETVPDLENLGISLDWQKRGFYSWRKLSLLQRLKKRRRTATQEVKSRLHLIGMKYGLIKPD